LDNSFFGVRSVVSVFAHCFELRSFILCAAAARHLLPHLLRILLMSCFSSSSLANRRVRRRGSRSFSAALQHAANNARSLGFATLGRGCHVHVVRVVAQHVDFLHFFCSQRYRVDCQILFLVFRIAGPGDDVVPFLERPAQNHLRGRDGVIDSNALHNFLRYRLLLNIRRSQ
jgi:hypothetical protein